MDSGEERRGKQVSRANLTPAEQGAAGYLLWFLLLFQCFTLVSTSTQLPTLSAATAVPAPSLSMITPITSSSLLQFIRSHSDTVFVTRSRRAAFSAEVMDGTLVITPHSTRKPRRLRGDVIDRVCAEFTVSGSLSPGDYHDITFDSSYLVTLIEARQSADQS